MVDNGGKDIAGIDEEIGFWLCGMDIVRSNSPKPLGLDPVGSNTLMVGTVEEHRVSGS